MVLPHESQTCWKFFKRIFVVKCDSLNAPCKVRSTIHQERNNTVAISWVTVLLSARFKSSSIKTQWIIKGHLQSSFVAKLNWQKLNIQEETGQQTIYSCSIYGGKKWVISLTPLQKCIHHNYCSVWIYDYVWSTKSTAAFNNKLYSSFVSITRFNKGKKKSSSLCMH